MLLATDGYGNAQVVEAWPAAFSEDLAWMLRDRDVSWLASQLPSWAARCASSDGSADDTTVALMISPDQGRRCGPAGPDSGAGDAGSEETTIPAVPHADTVPAQIPDRHPDTEPMEPVTLRLLAHRRRARAPDHRAGRRPRQSDGEPGRNRAADQRAAQDRPRPGR